MTLGMVERTPRMSSRLTTHQDMVALCRAPPRLKQIVPSSRSFSLFHHPRSTGCIRLELSYIDCFSCANLFLKFFLTLRS
jgi:hypothetical protein